MTAQTAETQNGAAKRANVVAMSPPRLAYDDLIQERFGIDKASWRVLVDAIFPAAETTESVVLALSYCKARKLDPFKRPVNIVPMWDSKRKRMVETIWPGIGELRTTAFRTGSYAGKDATEFGPDIELMIGNVKMTVPEWAQVTVYRLVEGARCKFVGPKVYFAETVGTKKDGSPNAMWLRRPRGQLDKVSEAASLRTAYPEEIGNEYIPEEVHGQALTPDADGIYSPGQSAAPPPRPSREDFETKAEDTFTLYDEVGETVGEFVATEWAAKLGDLLPEIGRRGNHNVLRVFWEANREMLTQVARPAAVRDLEDEYRNWMRHCNEAGLAREEKAREEAAAEEQDAAAAREDNGAVAPATGQSEDPAAPAASNETAKSNTAEESFSPTEDPEGWAARTKRAIEAAATTEQLAAVTKSAEPFYDAIKAMGFEGAVAAIAEAINAKATNLARQTAKDTML